MKHKILVLYAILLLFGYGCRSVHGTETVEPALIPIIKTALYDSTSVFFGDFGNYPYRLGSAPIGIFDSGTGGLTVLEAILTFDGYNNITGAEGPDGVNDFAGESFIYLADQANMPYGNYAPENKTDFLRELIIQDALFLMGKRVKSIVVACNTATATGLEDIRTLLEMSGTGVSVTGVIHAGAQGALESLSKEESGTIGVMATVGTIQTKGYERTIKEMACELGYTGSLQVVNQPAMGFAEAVDEEPDFLSRTATKPQSNYRGPSLGHLEFPIDPKILDLYHFDFSNNGMLYEGAPGAYTQLQLNSAQNYARYHLISLLEKLRTTPDPQPLKVLIMGCTHYPYYKETLVEMLYKLRDYRSDGIYPYRDFIAEEVVMVDPAVNTAKALYLLLREQKMNATKQAFLKADFYITVPNINLPEVDLTSQQRFTYDYKYGRNPGTFKEDVQTVPFSENNIDEEILKRFRTTIPVTFSLIQDLH